MFWKSHFPVDGKLAVISGASQGLGAELSRQIFAKGGSVLLCARSADKLKAVCEEIEETRVNEQQTVAYVSVDLSSYEGCEEVFESLGDRVPDIIICCAGYSIPKLFTDLSPEELQNGVNANYLTSLYLSHVGMKKMAAKGDGKTVKRHIVFVSSVVAFYPFIGYGQYAPTKAAIKSLSDVLRQEGIPYNIEVETVFPGNFMSEGYLEEQKVKPEVVSIIEGSSDAIPIDECATRILTSLDSGRKYVTTDLVGWGLNCLVLGNSPRTFGVFQFIVGFIWLLVAPIGQFIINGIIKDYFKKQKKLA